MMRSAQADRVKTAVIQILRGRRHLRQEGYENQTTGHRGEISGPWDWVVRRRLDTGLSLVEAMVTPAPE